MAPSNKKTRKKTGKAASIYDVARESGVSVFTVSAVVNKKAHVGKRLRESVEAAIRKLNYRPNLIARSLANRRTHTIGMIVPDIGNPFFPLVVRGAEDAAQKHGYNLLLCNSDDILDKERACRRVAPFQTSRRYLAHKSFRRLPVSHATDDQRGQRSFCSGHAHVCGTHERCRHHG